MAKFYLNIEVYYNNEGKHCVMLKDTDTGYTKEMVADSIEEIGANISKELQDYYEILDDIS